MIGALRAGIVFVAACGGAQAAPPLEITRVDCELPPEEEVDHRTLGEVPSPEEIAAVMQALAPDVRRCVGSTGRVFEVSVVLDGATGHARSAQFPPVAEYAAECLERTFTAAEFPRFRRDSYTVSHPFP